MVTGDAGALCPSSFIASRGIIRAHHQDGKGVAFASAWLATDNVIVSLFKTQTPAIFENLSLVGVDTLHLFPETYDVSSGSFRSRTQQA